MKLKLLVILLGLFCLTNAQKKFEVVLLIDRPYDAAEFADLLEKFQISSLIEEDYLKIKMISASDNDSKIKYDNGFSGKENKKCDVILNAGVRCNPCQRLNKEKSEGKVEIFVQTSDNAFGTCDLGIDDYGAISSKEDLNVLIKEQKKIAKKSKSNYKVIFWIPSDNTISIDLIPSTSDKKVEFGTEVTFTSNTNSEENINVVMKINDELIDECSETGYVGISKNYQIQKTIEIIGATRVTLDGKDCEVTKEIEIGLTRDCSEELNKVEQELMYVSKKPGVGSLGEKSGVVLDGVPCTTIKLIDKNLYFIIIKKQCNFRDYGVELIDVKTKEKFTVNLVKDEGLNQSLSHLSSSDRQNYSLFIMKKTILEDLGILKERKDGTEPKYNMRIVPIESYKKDLDIKGYESDWAVVKFQKC
jgi:hypothetical protein